MSSLRMRCHTPQQLCNPSCSFTPAAVCRPVRMARVQQCRQTNHQQSALACKQSKRSAVLVNAISTGDGMAPQLKSAIDTLIQSNKVVVFMKGTKEFPQCGFSNNVVQILRALDAPFESVNILENEMLRSGMKEYSQWPTFPQVYIDGEFYGGCDIMIEAFQNGELQETLERVLNE